MDPRLAHDTGAGFLPVSLNHNMLIRPPMSAVPLIPDIDHLSLGAEGLVHRGKGLASLYADMGVTADKVILRLPGTWEGIQAAKQLEALGIATHVVLIYRYSDLFTDQDQFWIRIRYFAMELMTTHNLFSPVKRGIIIFASRTCMRIGGLQQHEQYGL